MDTESETIDIDGEDDNFADNALNLKNLISLNKAVSAAQPKVRHATATEAALKQKGNVTYWEIQFNKGQKQPDVHVDAIREKSWRLTKTTKAFNWLTRTLSQQIIRL